MTRLFDNIRTPLGEHLQQTFVSFDRMDVAVGYFNLRGWSFFDDLVTARTYDELPGVRVLIGMSAATTHDEVLDELQATVDGLERSDADGDTSRQRRAELLQQLRTQLMRGMPTPGDRATLASLRQLLADGVVEIKVFTRRALHGKA